MNDRLAGYLRAAWARADGPHDDKTFERLADELRSDAGIAALREDETIWRALATETADGIAGALDQERLDLPPDDPGRVVLGLAAATAHAYTQRTNTPYQSTHPR